MSNEIDVFDSYVSAVDTLKHLFGNNRKDLVGHEITSSYDAHIESNNLDWLKNNLLRITKYLVELKFEVDIEFSVHNFGGKLSYFRRAGDLDDVSNLICNFEQTTVEEEYTDELPVSAQIDYEVLKEELRTDTDNMKFGKISKLLEPFQRKGIATKIRLNIVLNKNQIKELFFKGIGKDSQQNLILYLFPDKFVTELENIRIEDYEKEFYENNKRNIIIIFDLFGYIQNDFQVIIGQGYNNRIRDLISKPISEDSRSKYRKIIDLNKSHGLGFSTNLIPEMFSMEFNKLDDPGKAIVKQLRSFQAILSTIYLSGRVDSSQSGYSVQFKGIKQFDLSIKRSDYLNFEAYLPGIYELYIYAYDGFSIDKLELAEKFTSLIADNIESLCKKAKDIEGATKSSYENILLNRTKDYFDARQNVQDTINSSIKDTSDNIVTLTKETAKEVYTIAGIILLGLIGTALDPKLNIWITTFIVSLIIAVYMLLAIGYYLETLKNSQELGLQQYSAYIQSFKDILGEKTTKDFIDNENIKKSNDMFLEKLERARSIYELILIASLTTACFSVLVLLDVVQITLNLPKG